MVYATNFSGAWQVHAWDRVAGSHRQVTKHPTGLLDGTVTPDGSAVLWFEDARGDEIGRWLMQPFGGGPTEPLLPEVPSGWSAGLALGPDHLAAVGVASRDGFAVHIGLTGGSTRELYRHEQTAGVAGITRDGRTVLVEHAEHGDNLHPALRAFDSASGMVLADLWDGPGYAVHAAAASPVTGDSRVAVLHERTGILRPAVWDPRTGAWVDVVLDLPGEVEVPGWWPDGSALLLLHRHLGRDELYRYDLDAGVADRLDHPDGSITAARVRPDGAVWYRLASGALPPAVRAVGKDDPILVPTAQGPLAPLGAPYDSWTFTNPEGDQVHGFVATPDLPGPHPLVLLVHGGPHAQDTDAYSPQVQAWVDHGYAVAMVNYRGSTGYGKRWQDALDGDPGRPEVEDLVAGRDDLIARGVADPDRVVIVGASWGGYLALQTVGTVPGGWRAAVAVVPVADYLSAFEDESEALQAFDRSMFGGSPTERPELYRERSPISHVGNVDAPVLLMVGENDTRCPLQQVLNYAQALRDLGKPVDLDRFDAGHGALVTEERIRQMQVQLDFIGRHVPAPVRGSAAAIGAVGGDTPDGG